MKMATEGTSDVKSKESALDIDFEWGKMPQQDLSGQFTRSMVEMRKPKAFELRHPPEPQNQEKQDQVCKEIEIPKCPITIHTIKLIKYVRQVRDLLNILENRGLATYGYSNKISELSQPPVLDLATASKTRRSRSSSSGKSNDVESEQKYIFSVPEAESDFKLGLKISDFPSMDEGTASRVLKKSVATVSAHCGFNETTSSVLSVLTGITESYMISFSKSLRDTLDHEAETGRTAFYDSLDQVLHESGLSGMKDIQQYWEESIVKRHGNLQRQAERLSKKLDSLKYPQQEDVKTQVKPEKSFAAPYGKWTPVLGMSSSPYNTGRTMDTTSMIGSWMGHAVKNEPQDTNYPGTSQQIKSEYGSTLSSNPGTSMDILNTAGVDDPFSLDEQQSMFGIDDYRLPKKKQRNL